MCKLLPALIIASNEGVAFLLSVILDAPIGLTSITCGFGSVRERCSELCPTMLSAMQGKMFMQRAMTILGCVVKDALSKAHRLLP